MGKENKSKVKKVILLIATSTLICLISIFPFEQWIFRFSTPEEALKFDYTSRVKKVLAKVENDNYAYVSYIDKSGEWTSKYLRKDNRGWISPIKKIVLSNKGKHEKDYFVTSYIERREYLLVVYSSSFLNKEEVVKSVSDSIGTHFENVTYEYNGVYCRS